MSKKEQLEDELEDILGIDGIGFNVYYDFNHKIVISDGFKRKTYSLTKQADTETYLKCIKNFVDKAYERALEDQRQAVKEEVEELTNELA